MRLRVVALALALAASAGGTALLGGCGDGVPTLPAVSRARTITAAGMAARIAAIADDSLRGRLTPSPELDRVAAYAVAEFRSFGLRPGLPTGFVQTWPVPESGAAPNVVGILDGRDPSDSAEYVLFVAHMDHLGTTARGPRCQPAGADTICNGADDNASGTAGVIELARAFGGLDPAPRRSMIFLLVSGEEEGLLGSAWYVAHPAVPLGRTVAALNLDMISRNAPDSVFVVDMDASSLGGTVRRVLAVHEDLALSAAIPDLQGGSDQVPFEQAGVPSLFLFAGLHADYHRPTDEPARVDADKAARIVRLAYWIGYETAEGAGRPAWTADYVPARPLAPLSR